MAPTIPQLPFTRIDSTTTLWVHWAELPEPVFYEVMPAGLNSIAFSLGQTLGDELIWALQVCDFSLTTSSSDTSFKYLASLRATLLGWQTRQTIDLSAVALNELVQDTRWVEILVFRYGLAIIEAQGVVITFHDWENGTWDISSLQLDK